MNWTEEEIQAVWGQGAAVPTYRPDKWRKDPCGAWIARDHYDDTNSDFGWQIDHILPAEHGGASDLSNLRPLHWKNKATKRGVQLRCPVKAFAGGNVDRS